MQALQLGSVESLQSKHLPTGLTEITMEVGQILAWGASTNNYSCWNEATEIINLIACSRAIRQRLSNIH